jgi:hypothetical protein
MYACKSLKIQGNLCIEFYAQKCERNSIRGRRIFIGFPDKFVKPAFYAGLVSLDFTGDNRRGAPHRSNQCGDCYSTQKSVHKSGNKVAGFVGYGGAGGVRAVENLRLVMGEIKIADVRAQVSLSMWTDFENFTTFKPHEQHDKAVHLMADEVIAWGGALKPLRATH